MKNLGFINFDDNMYVTENAEINAGLTAKGFARAFRFSREGDSKTYYHPLSYISHMLDCELFGLQPSGHHLMNLGFHILNTLLLFLMMRKSGIQYLQSVLICALFAVHPLQVESVAWVAERKNLLSSCCWFLAVLTYMNYAAKPNPLKYLFLTFLFFLGLLAKPILLTLPCTLLLLDIWPLKRFHLGHTESGSRISTSLQEDLLTGIRLNFHLLREKIPLFLITILWFLVSIHAAASLNESPTELDVPMQLRIANGIVSYIHYLINFFWPFDLSVFYPYPRSMLPFGEVFAAAFVLLLITIYVIRKIRTRPYLSTGWLWFLGTLFPALGLSQTGLWPAMADRWMYVPMVGILFILAGSINKMTTEWKHSKKVFFIPTGAAIGILCFLSHVQLNYWQNQMTLFEHAARVTPNNHYAHYAIGLELLNQHKNEEALQHFLRAREYNPDSFLTLVGIGQAMIALNENTKAMEVLQSVIKSRPKHDPALFLLGMAYFNNAQPQTALHFFRSALAIRPGMPLYYNGVGMALLDMGNTTEASSFFVKALALDPHNPDAKRYLLYIQNSQAAHDEKK